MIKKIIGITGGIGCGKSTVTSYLAKKYKATAVIMDDLGRELMQPGRIVYDKIIKTFGTDILRDDKFLDNARLSAIVFSDEKKLAKLNSIIHPEVLKETLEIINSSAGLIAIETALPIEAKLDEYCDEIWYVYVPEEIRIKRLLENRGANAEKWKSIISKQCSEEDFLLLADRIIDNSGTPEQTEKQIVNNMRI